MAKTILTTANDLPDCLKAEDVGGYLGISRANAYELVKKDGFPRLELGKRIIIPKDAFLRWLESNTRTTTI